MTGLESAILKIFFGAFIGAVVTYWRTKYTVYSTDFSKRLETVCDLVDEYSECACRYWSHLKQSDELKSNKHYVAGLQARLSTKVNAMNQDYSGFNSKAVLNAIHDLNHECTGGDFATKPITNEYRIAAILKKAEIVKSELYKVRIKRY
ncbi:MAG: hypothetical protein GYB23_04830 [Vibrionaceae bacterium]|nr:hypothetical protein [Vibrionaceae bacterium]